MTTQKSEIQTTIVSQIARMDLFAISGGRVKYCSDPDVIELPVRYGYSVRVIYNAVPDVYTVQRVYRRGLKEFLKGEVTNVYWDELSEACYKASCYYDAF